MEDLVHGREGIVLRKIDIVKWSSDVAKQHKIRGLPHLILYADGKPVAEGAQAVLNALSQ